MDFDAYQAASRETAQYPDMGRNVCYPTLGLAGEAGEVAERVKKMFRDDGGVLTPQRRDALKAELGDVLWYVAALCSELDLRMDDVASNNVRKLRDRRARSVIQGDGDER
ncbi:MAG: nucleoside triphosphate pyrophosphohydrolase family protein [Planctomycetes bacterium]|nr:nucleoside triphosphate pyrophosphohydrolase family protein [Planctomycetota bacterium]